MTETVAQQPTEQSGEEKGKEGREGWVTGEHARQVGKEELRA